MDRQSPFQYRESCVFCENVVLRVMINEHILPPSQQTEFVTHMHHTHAHTELFACFKNQISISYAQGTLTLHENDIALFPANLPHHKLNLPDDGEFSAIGFTLCRRATRNVPDLYAAWNPLCCGKQPLIFNQLPDLANGVRKIAESPANEEYLPAMRLLPILAELSSLHSSHHMPNVSIPFPTAGKDIDRMNYLDHIINSGFTHALSAEDVAGMLFVSPRQLSRIVRKRYGCSFRQVLQKKRLDTAKRLLLETDQTIEEIGASVGFHSYGYFNQKFKEAFNISPSLFRKQHKTKKSFSEHERERTL